jgi:hypothetical protein
MGARTGYPWPDLCLLLPFAQASAASAVIWLGWFGCEIRPAASASAIQPDLLSVRSGSLRYGEQGVMADE